MAEPHIAPYGSWKSPITSDLIVTATVGLGQIALDGDDTYWIELRPSEGGRNCLVRRTPGGRAGDVTPPDFNARRNRLLAVREDHTVEGREAVNTIVALDAGGANEEGGRVLVSGND